MSEVLYNHHISPPEQNAGIDEKTIERIAGELKMNFLVEAVPGSGKTFNLVQRMLALVKSGVPAPQIAAITFTRKAAEELRGRFREAAGAAAASATESACQMALENSLLEIEDGYIGTIHGFCARILREYPVEANIDPGFVEIDEETEEQLFLSAWSQFLDENLQYLDFFAEAGVSPMDKTLVSDLQSLCQYPEVDFACFEKSQQPDPSSLCRNICEFRQLISDCSPLQTLAQDELAENHQQIKYWSTFETLAKRLEEFSGHQVFSPSELSSVWRALLDVPALKLSLELDDDRLAKAIQNRLAGINFEIQKLRRDFSFAFFPVFFPMATHIRSFEKQWRCQHRVVSYLDLLTTTVQLLKSRQDIRANLHLRFSYMLIDEFQDTDPLQAEMAFLLAAENTSENDWLKTIPAPGSLFLVGDPKQSVYRFRRADIEIYHQAAERLKTTGGEILTLKQNRRATGSLCKWANQVFEPAFSQQKSLGQADFVEMLPLRGNSDFAPVQALQIPDSINGNATRKMCRHDAAIYAEIVASMLGRSVKGLNNDRPLRPEDFLLLCSKNDDLVTYAVQFEEKGIPTSLTGGGKKLASILAREFEPLYWLLRAISEGNNSAIVYGVLVGPVFGLSEEQVFDWKRRKKRLKLAAEPLDPVRNVLRRLGAFRSWSRTMPPGTAFRKIVARLKFDTKVQLSQYGMLKAAFLCDVEKLFDKKLFSAAVETLGNWIKCWPVDRISDEPGRLRLMTIHKAKGLEASVVILCGMHRSRTGEPCVILDRPDEENHRQKFTGKFRLRCGQTGHDFITSPDWQQSIGNESSAEKAERLRLDYVAVTRARDLLIISRHIGRSGSVLSPLSGELAAEVAACPEFKLPFDVSESADRQIQTPKPEALEYWYKRRIVWQAGASIQQNDEIKTNSSIEDQNNHVKNRILSKKQAGGRIFQRFMHSLVCDMMRWNEMLDSDSLQGFDKIIDFHLHDYVGLKPKRPVIRQYALNLLQHPLWLEASSSTPLTMVNISYKENSPATSPLRLTGLSLPTFMHSTIDLIFRSGNDWKLVIYKTCAVEHEEHRQLLNSYYLPQLNAYAEQWEALNRVKVLRRSLFYLSDGTEVEFVAKAN